MKHTKLRLLYEDVITSLAFSGFFEIPTKKTTWHRVLKREEDGQEIIVSALPDETLADNPIIIRFPYEV